MTARFEGETAGESGACGWPVLGRCWGRGLGEVGRFGVARCGGRGGGSGGGLGVVGTHCGRGDDGEESVSGVRSTGRGGFSWKSRVCRGNSAV